SGLQRGRGYEGKSAQSRNGLGRDSGNRGAADDSYYGRATQVSATVQHSSRAAVYNCGRSSARSRRGNAVNDPRHTAYYSTASLIEGDLAVIAGDGKNRGSLSRPGTFGSLVAKIPLGNKADSPLPRDVALTPDNTRAYVTLRNSGQIAVVDAITLREIDVNA